MVKVSKLNRFIAVMKITVNYPEVIATGLKAANSSSFLEIETHHIISIWIVVLDITSIMTRNFGYLNNYNCKGNVLQNLRLHVTTF